MPINYQACLFYVTLNQKKAAELYLAYHNKRKKLIGFADLTNEGSYGTQLEKLANDWGDFIAVLDKVDTQGRTVIICKECVFKLRFNLKIK